MNCSKCKFPIFDGSCLSCLRIELEITKIHINELKEDHLETWKTRAEALGWGLQDYVPCRGHSLWASLPPYPYH